MRTDLRKLTPIQRTYAVAYRRAFHVAYRLAGQDYREELALLGKAHREEMAHLAATYDQELKNLADDFAALARAHHQEMLRRAVAEAQAEREQCPWRPLH